MSSLRFSKHEIALVALSAFFLLLGVASFVDGRRIATTTRLRGTLDLIGPDYFLMGVGVIMLAIGIALAVKALRTGDASAGAPMHQFDSNAHLVVTGILIAYVLLLPVIGYTFSTLLLFVGLFRTTGIQSWIANLAGSVAATAIFYAIFVLAADMALPRGFVGF